MQPVSVLLMDGSLVFVPNCRLSLRIKCYFNLSQGARRRCRTGVIARLPVSVFIATLKEEKVNWGEPAALRTTHAPNAEPKSSHQLCASSHLPVPRRHCRSSSPACVPGCWRTGRIPARRGQPRPAWRTRRRWRSRKGRSPAPWKRSGCREASSGRGASQRTCQSRAQRSPPAVKISVMVNNGN